MRYPIFIIALILGLQVNTHAQKTTGNKFKIAFYNTENLFDTIDDPNKNDNDFLPGSKVAWTSQRYNLKVQHIAKVLVAIDSINLPAVIGMAEIENIGVLNDLVNTPPLLKGKYKTILEEGPDPRGIDVALIYRSDILHYISHRAFPAAQTFNTRSILFVRLADSKKDTFNIFVNHWKSREGNGNETESKRMENAGSLKHLTDSLFARNPKANIVIMGDFNDEPGDKSLSEKLGALKPDQKIMPASLYNLMYLRFLNGEGTLYYKDWDMFDQVIVSGHLLPDVKHGKGAVILPPYSSIFKQEWMLYKNKAGDLVPNRTASSKDYFGGYSDHLPVYVTVNY
ncbi:MAG: endonuclease/exonuclease/phosphatase family protein [Bacteroidota bacterium]